MLNTDLAQFHGNAFPTIGVEQEFHLIDPESAQLVPAYDQVIAQLPPELRSTACHELFLAVLEMRSPVCRTVAELVANVIAGRTAAAAAATRAGVRLVAAGSHPFADWRRLDFVDSPHYHWVRREHGYLVNRMLAFGLHVHVGMQSGDAALYSMHELRRWLFPLLAFSVNSPFFEGDDTGIQSIRTHLFHGLPRSFLPPDFTSMHHYNDLFVKLAAAGDITEPGSLWWTIRPQPTFGTIEVRTLDLPTRPERIGVLVAIIQAALATFQDQFNAGVGRTPMQQILLEQNEWKAMHEGLDGTVIDPATGELRSMRDQFSALLDLVAPKAAELGSAAWLDTARRRLSEPTEAQQQRQRYVQLGHDLRKLELELAELTTSG